jgi:hypothetical protein
MACAIGRRNFMFLGSDTGEERAAAMYSLVGLCKFADERPYRAKHECRNFGFHVPIKFLSCLTSSNNASHSLLEKYAVVRPRVVSPHVTRVVLPR